MHRSCVADSSGLFLLSGNKNLNHNSEASKQGLTKGNTATMVAIWYNHVRSTKLGTIYGFSLKDTPQKEVLAGGV